MTDVYLPVKCPALPWYSRWASEPAEMWVKIIAHQHNGLSMTLGKWEQRIIQQFLPKSAVLYDNPDQTELYLGCSYTFYDHLMDMRTQIIRALDAKDVTVIMLFKRDRRKRVCGVGCQIL